MPSPTKKTSRPAAAKKVTRRKPGLAATSIKLPAEMKTAIGRLARKEGRTTHGYMLVLLKEGLDRASKWQEFLDDAVEALEESERTGIVYLQEDVERYMEEKAQGKNPPEPKPTRWRK